MTLIPVTMLETKLGRTLGPPDTPQHQKAAQAIWVASTRAQALADQQWTPDTVPDIAATIILEAAYRLHTNPNRHLANTAIGMTAQLSHNELDGDIFLRAEREQLQTYGRTGIWTHPTTRT